MWDTSVVEWYYPALSSGVTHAVINRSTAVDVVSRLNEDPDLVEALSRAAKRVQAELVCADCIAAHIARVANRTRERMGYGSILDDADRMLRLAKQAGACDNFVKASASRVQLRHRPRHSRMNLTARQNTPAIDAAIYYPNSTLYQLQPSFHTKSTEPEPTARARRAGEEFY